MCRSRAHKAHQVSVVKHRFVCEREVNLNFPAGMRAYRKESAGGDDRHRKHPRNDNSRFFHDISPFSARRAARLSVRPRLGLSVRGVLFAALRTPCPRVYPRCGGKPVRLRRDLTLSTSSRRHPYPQAAGGNSRRSPLRRCRRA